MNVEHCAIPRHRAYRICVDLYILRLKHLSYHHAFYNKLFQTLFLDQLAWYKANFPLTLKHVHNWFLLRKKHMHSYRAVLSRCYVQCRKSNRWSVNCVDQLSSVYCHLSIVLTSVLSLIATWGWRSCLLSYVMVAAINRLVRWKNALVAIYLQKALDVMATIERINQSVRCTMLSDFNCSTRWLFVLSGFIVMLTSMVCIVHRFSWWRLSKADRCMLHHLQLVWFVWIQPSTISWN